MLRFHIPRHPHRRALQRRPRLFYSAVRHVQSPRRAQRCDGMKHVGHNSRGELPLERKVTHALQEPSGSFIPREVSRKVPLLSHLPQSAERRAHVDSVQLIEVALDDGEDVLRTRCFGQRGVDKPRPSAVSATLVGSPSRRWRSSTLAAAASVGPTRAAPVRPSVATSVILVRSASAAAAAAAAAATRILLGRLDSVETAPSAAAAAAATLILSGRPTSVETPPAAVAAAAARPVLLGRGGASSSSSAVVVVGFRGWASSAPAPAVVRRRRTVRPAAAVPSVRPISIVVTISVRPAAIVASAAAVVVVPVPTTSTSAAAHRRAARGGARVARVKRRAARGTAAAATAAAAVAAAAAAAVRSASAAAGGLPTGFVTSFTSPAPVVSAASTSPAT
jgi:hypothetical protein